MMPVNTRRFMIGLLCLGFLPAWAGADDDSDVLFNQVHLEASAEREIENDQLEVILAVEVQGRDPDTLARQVNETMAWALERARTVQEVEARTLSYRTHPVYRDQVVTAWRASQQLHLSSQAITDLTGLVGDLQDRLQVKQMSFSVSRQAQQQLENELIGAAMQAFRERVAAVQQHMQGMDYRIVSLNINTGGRGPERSMVMAMESRDSAAPVVEAGTSRVSVSVSGSVQFY